MRVNPVSCMIRHAAVRRQQMAPPGSTEKEREIEPKVNLIPKSEALGCGTVLDITI